MPTTPLPAAASTLPSPPQPLTRRDALARTLAQAVALTPALSLAVAFGVLQPTQAEARAPARPRPAPAPRYAGHAGVAVFAREAAARRGLNERWIIRQLGKAHRIEAARRLVMPPPAGTAKNWAAYRSRFVEPQRIAAGLDFWREQEGWLSAAQLRWGVPSEIVVAIVGVETYYGRITGNYRVIDALATLSFDFPAGRRDRSVFFRGELEEFFVYCAREGVDPQLPKGSYAGAIGLPQFMPGSLNRYALDFDGDGHVDLARSPADVVGSVAHYLAVFGWQRDLPTHYAVAVPVDSADRAALLAGDIVPGFSAAQFAQRGAELGHEARAHDGLLALVELQNGELAPSYIAGTSNFYVLTRYNWSSYYAMAVVELAQALRAAR